MGEAFMEIDRGLPMKLRVAAVFGAVGAIWGSAWIPSSALPPAFPEWLAGALRFGLASVLLAVAAAVMRRCRPGAERSPVRKLLGPSVVLGAIMLAVPYALTAWAAGRVSPGMVALCFALMPMAALLFEGEGRAGAIPAVALGVGGVAMVVAPGLSADLQQAGGCAALLAAMGLGAFSLMYVRRLYARSCLRSGDILTMAAIQMGAAAVLLSVPLCCTGPDTSYSSMKTAALPLALLAIAVSGGSLPFLLWLLGRMAGWQAATLQWASTLVAVAEAGWVLHARPAVEGWIGAALIPACICWIFLGADGWAGGGGPGAVTLEITKLPFPGAKASEFRERAE